MYNYIPNKETIIIEIMDKTNDRPIYRILIFEHFLQKSLALQLKVVQYFRIVKFSAPYISLPSLFLFTIYIKIGIKT